MLRRSIGSPVLFTVVYTSLASAIYFSLGVDRRARARADPARVPARGAALRADGDDLRRGRVAAPGAGGSTVFARYAFNELVSFIAGWAMLLDYMILIAVYAPTRRPSTCASSGPRSGTAHRGAAAVAGVHRVRRARATSAASAAAARGAIGLLVVGDLALQLLIVVIGLVAVLQPAHADRPDPPRQRAEMVGSRVRADGRRDRLHEPRVRGRARRRGEDQPRAACKRMVGSGAATVIFVYVGHRARRGHGAARARRPHRARRRAT